MQMYYFYLLVCWSSFIVCRAIIQQILNNMNMTKINIASLSSFVRKRVHICPRSLLWSIFLQIFKFHIQTICRRVPQRRGDSREKKLFKVWDRKGVGLCERAVTFKCRTLGCSLFMQSYCRCSFTERQMWVSFLQHMHTGYML